MAKKRDWVDSTNLESNVAQNFQLHHVNQTLAGLGLAATERAAREQQERGEERTHTRSPHDAATEI